ncbi:MAG: hypothetical protein IPL62_02450 [Caulobacteraceae bacterium]|nr:hypothetical protein [Caulobacteraceae bacterium]
MDVGIHGSGELLRMRDVTWADVISPEFTFTRRSMHNQGNALPEPKFKVSQLGIFGIEVNPLFSAHRLKNEGDNGEKYPYVYSSPPRFPSSSFAISKTCSGPRADRGRGSFLSHQHSNDKALLKMPVQQRKAADREVRRS